MPIEDLHAGLTALIRAAAAQTRAIERTVGDGDLPASTELFRACAELFHAADKLYRTVELELSVRLAEREHVPGQRSAVTR